MPLFTEKSLTSISKHDKKMLSYRYEAKSIVWGTSVPRAFAEEINEFLKKCGYTKVELIQAGYEELLARHDTAFAKLKDGYDDFFESELTKFAEERNKT